MLISHMVYTLYIQIASARIMARKPYEIEGKHLNAALEYLLDVGMIDQMSTDEQFFVRILCMHALNTRREYCDSITKAHETAIANF